MRIQTHVLVLIAFSFFSVYFSRRYRHFIVLLVSSQSAEDHLEWCGLVESRVRTLIGMLANNQHISLAHVNPKCFERTKVASGGNGGGDAGDKPVMHCSMWFIGLEFERTENLNVDLTESIQYFTNSVHKQAVSNQIVYSVGKRERRDRDRENFKQKILHFSHFFVLLSKQVNIKLRKEGMEIEARHVRRKQLSQYLDKELLNRERKSMEAATATAQSLASSMKKRISDPSQTPPHNQQHPPAKRNRANDSVRTVCVCPTHAHAPFAIVHNHICIEYDSNRLKIYPTV